jgi:L-rhamnono-1,4-lactonase
MVELLDSHIHLWNDAQLPRLAWMTDENALNSCHDLAKYKSESDAKGYIFVETDRKSSLDTSGWEDVLEEYAYVVGLKDPMLKGAVLWAPVPGGSALLDSYYHKLEEICPDGISLVKGFRYLLQDKPPGTMLDRGFVEGVNWMARKGLVFDLGVDMRSGGLWQLEEAVQLVEQAPDCVFIISM